MLTKVKGGVRSAREGVQNGMRIKDRPGGEGTHKGQAEEWCL